MWIFDFILLLLLVFYLGLMLYYKHYWINTPEFVANTKTQPNIALSVLIAARNEANNIAECLESIEYQNYPRHLYEIIVIDDHSSDATAAIVRRYAERLHNVKLLHLTDYKKENEITAHKKAALEYGMTQAEGELIITTDADCVASPNWLVSIADCYTQTQACAITAPVLYHREEDVFQHCQSLDMCGMMGVTASSITSRVSYMCNGANFAFTRKVFDEVGGYQGIDRLASGDDVMLLIKIAEKYPEKIVFLKTNEAAIRTYANRTIKKFIQQRLRWATKNSQLSDRSIPWLLGGVYVFNLLLLISSVVQWIYLRNALCVASFVWLSKLVIDLVLLKSTTQYFKKQDLMKYFLPAQFGHVCYIILIGTLALFVKKYKWKERTLH